MLRVGFKLVFHKIPQLSPVPIPFRTEASSLNAAALRENVHLMLSKGAIECVADVNSPGFYSHLCRTKEGGRLATGNRSLDTKPVPCDPKVQDGDSRVDTSCSL